MSDSLFPGPVLVMGAGSIGCYLGGALAGAGADVGFVGRPRVLAALRAHGLTVTDLDGARVELPASKLELLEHVPANARPSLVLLTVKSGATAAAAAELGAALPAGTLVLSMQNGVSNAAVASSAAPSLRVLPGMVPYNVAELGPGHFHRGTTGYLAAQDYLEFRDWAVAFERAGLPLTMHADLRAIQWGKLLLNLNNPVNALSGLPLRDQLLVRGYRQCLAALIDESRSVLATAGIEPAAIGAVKPAMLSRLLRLPTPLFRIIAARMLRIDPKARSSMADDLQLGRPTEIDALCGAVVELARERGGDAPLNRRMVELVKAAPGALSAGQLKERLGVE
jgi:2-dehydropantoate 2-reductase